VFIGECPSLIGRHFGAGAVRTDVLTTFGWLSCRAPSIGDAVILMHHATPLTIATRALGRTIQNHFTSWAFCEIVAERIGVGIRQRRCY